LFWIDAKGDLHAKGALHGRRVAGEVSIQSGTVDDQMKVPLPIGVSEEEVESKSVVLHVTVTPMYTVASGGFTDLSGNCHVAADRTVTTQTPGGTCLYQVVAAVSSPTTGGQP
jgi:hypothetical protein